MYFSVSFFRRIWQKMKCATALPHPIFCSFYPTFFFFSFFGLLKKDWNLHFSISCFHSFVLSFSTFHLFYVHFICRRDCVFQSIRCWCKTSWNVKAFRYRRILCMNIISISFGCFAKHHNAYPALFTFFLNRNSFLFTIAVEVKTEERRKEKKTFKLTFFFLCLHFSFQTFDGFLFVLIVKRDLLKYRPGHKCRRDKKWTWRWLLVECRKPHFRHHSKFIDSLSVICNFIVIEWRKKGESYNGRELDLIEQVREAWHQLIHHRLKR